MVKALAPDGADQPLDIRILPGRAWSSENLLNVHRFRGLRKRFSITPISVAKQVLRRGIPGESVDELLRRPASRRVSGHSKMHDAPLFMREHEEDEEHSQAGCGYDKEVGCDQIPAYGSSGMSSSFARLVYEGEPCTWQR